MFVDYANQRGITALRSTLTGPTPTSSYMRGSIFANQHAAIFYLWGLLEGAGMNYKIKDKSLTVCFTCRTSAEIMAFLGPPHFLVLTCSAIHLMIGDYFAQS